jgi:hypothetical protein
MLHQERLEVEFFVNLVDLDRRLAKSVAERGCRHCGGPLHRSDYTRKPRGGWLALAGETFTRRFSLCCGRRGCRKRAMPPSLRFLGRRVYLEAVVVLGACVAVASGLLRKSSDQTGVPARTLRRWLGWWSDVFPSTPVWVDLRARFAPPPPLEAELPKSLIERLFAIATQPSAAVVVLHAARLLCPLTTESVPHGSRFLEALSLD